MISGVRSARVRVGPGLRCGGQFGRAFAEDAQAFLLAQATRLRGFRILRLGVRQRQARGLCWDEILRMLPGDLPEGLRLAAAAIEQQVQAENAIASLLPVGLGEKNGEFNKVFTDAFQRIVVRGRDIQDSLDAEGEKLARIMEEADAACWQPDAPSEGPCPVE